VITRRAAFTRCVRALDVLTPENQRREADRQHRAFVARLRASLRELQHTTAPRRAH
jgi:hypothetical protein